MGTWLASPGMVLFWPPVCWFMGPPCAPWAPCTPILPKGAKELDLPDAMAPAPCGPEEVVVAEEAAVVPVPPDASPEGLALLPGAPLLETPPVVVDDAAPWGPVEGVEPEDCDDADRLEATGAGLGWVRREASSG